MPINPLYDRFFMPATLQSINGIQVATLNGPLDSIAGADLVTTIRTSADKEMSLILDFAMVPQMDPSGLKHLLTLNQGFQQGQRRLVLAALTPEVKRLMEENSITDKFESYPSREAAMNALRGKSAGSAPPVDDFGAFDAESGVVPEVESAIFSHPPPAASNASYDDWSAPAPAATTATAWTAGADDSGWDRYNKSPASDETQTSNPSSSKKKLYIGVAAVMLVMVIGIIWLISFLRVPEIRPSETTIVVQEGEELPPETSVLVVNGELDVEDIRLPAGLEFADSKTSDEGVRYYFYGLPKTAGRHAITLHASRGSRKSEPVEITFEIEEKKLEWLFAQPPMEENVPINKEHYSKVVSGARSVELRWVGEPLKGLEVRTLEGSQDTWQLLGTPAQGGSFQAEFIAATKSGREEKKSYTIQVKISPPPQPPPVIEPLPIASSDTAQTPKAAGDATPPALPPEPVPPVAPEAKDDRMRTFLMERIEKANNHFTDEDKALLRVIVGRLKEARLVATVEFGINKTSISSSQARDLKKTLQEPDIAKLLDSADCQLLVVGYASTSGSHALNLKLSQQRAQSVNDLLLGELKRRADLCGDYGPTDIISSKDAGNRVVEIYAGTIDISKEEQAVADLFKKDFNRRHGGGRQF